MIDYENGTLNVAGKAIELYEPLAALPLKDLGIVVAVGHEQLIVIDDKTGDILASTFTR